MSVASGLNTDLKWIVRHTANTCMTPQECVMGFMSDMNKYESTKPLLIKYNIDFMTCTLSCSSEHNFILFLSKISEFPEEFKSACGSSSTFKELSSTYV